MMSSFMCIIKKDFREYMRGKKCIIFSAALFAIGAMVILTTMFFPTLFSVLAEKVPDIISDSISLDSIRYLFPDNLKDSMGMWASSIGTFYSILIVLMVHGLIRKEIKRGAWIFPVASGYKKDHLMLSKALVYGLGSALPVFIFTNIFFFLASTFLDNNLSFLRALLSSIVLAFAIFGIATITILTSVFFKSSIVTALSMIGIVMVAPDVLSLFSFGRYFPTYLLTFVYTMESDFRMIIMPVVELISITGIIYFFAAKKVVRMDISR